MTTPGVDPVALSPIDMGVPWKGISFGLATAIIWGTWPVLSRFGVQQSLLAVDVAMLRFLVSGLVLLPLVLRRGHGGLGWGRAMVLAIGAGAPYALVTILGFSYAPAGHGGLIIPSVMLTCSTLGGWLLLKDRPNGKRLTGLVIVLSGVVTIGSAGTMAGDGFSMLWLGHVLFASGGMLWAVYTIFSRKWGADPLHTTALVSVLSLALYGPVYLMMQGTALVQAPIEELLLQGIAQGLVAAVLALICYTKAVALLGAGRAALFAALVPGFSALFAYPILGEVPTTRHLLGLALVTFGMVLALGIRFGRSRTKLPPMPT
ncbi:MAG: EamA family transporter [Rhodospirillaceae bacterium]|nr:EamA family transporter [Rhodospirillaceae bacterium]MAX60956.1 EamA family transporter [Rhodospirillaceae bacterium]MAX65278.1 EamA family transporter [Rhodospirillaceae bacterium]MBB55693.1 EamA family transporter [Rhodospirillaceae bacterium]|tara:strand:- start:16105 stop:17058 length:954 start_codon:yes stop_codon:yes gene_type:complete